MTAHKYLRELTNLPNTGFQDLEVTINYYNYDYIQVCFIAGPKDNGYYELLRKAFQNTGFILGRDGNV